MSHAGAPPHPKHTHTHLKLHFDLRVVGSGTPQVRATPAQRGQVRDLVGIFRADILDVGPTTMTIEMLGKEDKMKAFKDLLEPYGGFCVCVRARPRARPGSSMRAAAAANLVKFASRLLFKKRDVSGWRWHTMSPECTPLSTTSLRGVTLSFMLVRRHR